MAGRRETGGRPVGCTSCYVGPEGCRVCVCVYVCMHVCTVRERTEVGFHTIFYFIFFVMGVWFHVIWRISNR